MQTAKMDSDSAMESFQQQALEIRLPGPNFDPSVEPRNGEEFLMKMLHERKKCPAVVVRRPKNLDVSTWADGAASAMKLEKGKDLHNLSTSASLLPTTEWKLAQGEDFLEMRNKIATLRQEMAAQAYNNALEPPLTTDVEQWKNFCTTNPPFLRTILRINQRTMEQLLEMLCEWMQGAVEVSPEQEQLLCTSSSSSSAAAAAATNEVGAMPVLSPFDLSCSEQWLGSWLYAALACLHLPLEPNVHSTLRDIARICMQLRSRLLPQELEKAVPYNLFIYLIAKVFGQLDFAEFV